jgi:hypothetical protein
MTVEKAKCGETVCTDGWHFRKCSRNASVNREGKWYCGTHDPVARKAKSDKKLAEWRKESNSRYRNTKKNEILTRIGLMVYESKEDTISLMGKNPITELVDEYHKLRMEEQNEKESN